MVAMVEVVMARGLKDIMPSGMKLQRGMQPQWANYTLKSMCGVGMSMLDFICQ